MPHLPRYPAAAAWAASVPSLAARFSEPNTMSTGLIIGIAVPCGIAFFMVLGLLLEWVSRRSDVDVCPASGVSFAVGTETEAATEMCRRNTTPKRLRKKSIAASERYADNVGSAEGVVEIVSETKLEAAEREREREGELGKDGRLSIPPILPPVLSRPGSFTIGPLIADERDGAESWRGDAAGSSRSSVDAKKQRQKAPTRKSTHDIRKTTWIDEDALHGPPMASPRRNKGKKRESGGLLSALGRSLSRKLSWRAEVTEIIRSPTLPYTEAGGPASPARRVPDRRLAEAQDRLAGVLDRDLGANKMTIHAVSSSQVVTSPRKVCVQEPGPLAGRGSHCGFIVSIPSDNVHNPKYRNSKNSVSASSTGGNTAEALEATQRLAGSARVPVSVPLPVPAAIQQLQMQQQTPSPVTTPHRRPRSTKSATDADLAGILRSTAERLQDRRMAARRQTMQPASSQTSFLSVARVARALEGASVESSPAKSQKSAPAVMSCAELEGCSPTSRQGASSFPFSTPSSTTSSVPQGAAFGHRRQASHMSFASMISEPDSLFVGAPASRRASSDIPTALSSPSRRDGERAPTLGPEADPCSPASYESSALSTLYSEDEPPHPQSQQHPPPQSPPISELRLDATPTTANWKRATHVSVSSPRDDDVFGGARAGDVNGRGQKLAFEDGESPRPWRTRRRAATTMGPKAGRDENFSPPQQKQGSAVAPGERERSFQPIPVRTSLQFTIHAHDAYDRNGSEVDPFFTQARTPSLKALVPSPLHLRSPGGPAELPTNGNNEAEGVDDSMPVVYVTNMSAAELPAPSPIRPNSRATIIPPPQRLRPMISSPTLGGGHQGAISPVMSEAGLSSVYDSYADFEEEVGQHPAMSLPTVSVAQNLPTKTAITYNTPGSRTGDTVAIDHPSQGRESRAGFRASDAPEQHNAKENTNIAIKTVEGGIASAEPQQPKSPQTILRRPQAQSQPQPQPKRALRDSQDSDHSRYSQDDTVPPLLAPATQNRLNVAANANVSVGPSGGLCVASSVAELRRMNSQVSNTSGYSSTSAGGAEANANMNSNAKVIGAPSPTLPALRGGGFSPGRNKGAGRNYLSLGGSSPTGSAKNASAESSPGAAGGADRNGKENGRVVLQHRRSLGGASGRARRGTVTLGGGVDGRRAAAATAGLLGQVGDAAAIDGDKPSGVLREGNNGGNVGAGAGSATAARHPPKHAAVTRATQLVREEKEFLARASVESLGLYDEQGFLKGSSPVRGGDASSPLSRRL